MTWGGGGPWWGGPPLCHHLCIMSSSLRSDVCYLYGSPDRSPSSAGCTGEWTPDQLCRWLAGSPCEGPRAARWHQGAVGLVRMDSQTFPDSAAFRLLTSSSPGPPDSFPEPDVPGFPVSHCFPRKGAFDIYFKCIISTNLLCSYFICCRTLIPYLSFLKNYVFYVLS